MAGPLSCRPQREEADRKAAGVLRERGVLLRRLALGAATCRLIGIRFSRFLVFRLRKENILLLRMGQDLFGPYRPHFG